jgi:hypothetical protein
MHRQNRSRARAHKRYNVKPYLPAPEADPAPYWQGPYGMLVPYSIVSVQYSDGGNVIFRDGTISDAWVDPKFFLPKDRYLGMHATLGKDGQWYFVDRRAFKRR